MNCQENYHFIRYTIYADGSVGNEPIGTLISYYKSTAPYGYLVCNGSTKSDMSTKYPELYTFLGNSNKLPDYRECAIVGIGTNNTDNITRHDAYTIGEFKDDILQNHTHGVDVLFQRIEIQYTGQNDLNYLLMRNDGMPDISTYGVNNVVSSNVTRGKRKGALICIKAL